MLTIVGLLKGWESAVEEVQERSPPAVRPVIDRVLGEIGGLGFVDRVPLEIGVFGFFCLLNVFELALVPTTFLNLGLIEVVEDFVARQARAEDTPYAVDAPK